MARSWISKLQSKVSSSIFPKSGRLGKKLTIAALIKSVVVFALKRQVLHDQGLMKVYLEKHEGICRVSPLFNQMRCAVGFWSKVQKRYGENIHEETICLVLKKFPNGQIYLGNLCFTKKKFVFYILSGTGEQMNSSNIF